MRISPVVVTVLLVALLDSSGGQQLAGLGPLDLGRALRDRGYVQRQLHCVLERGLCDEVGNQLKQVIPEVLRTNCRSCSFQQAQTARSVINYISQNYPNEWAQIQRKYSQGHRF